jgi:hypothetical protein
MANGASKLKLTAYEKFGNGTASSPLSGGVYTLQLNPEQIDLGFDLNSVVEDDDEPASAAGMPVSDKNKVYNRKVLSVCFQTLISVCEFFGESSPPPRYRLISCLEIFEDLRTEDQKREFCF